jgi:hypothetical protein
MKKILLPLIFFFALLILVFGAHAYTFTTMGLAWNSHQIIAAYLVNTAVVIFILAAILILPDMFSQARGQIFLGGSMLKFLLFFVMFYPAYKQDGDLSRVEFFTFFVPYIVCLLSETIISIRLINSD